jgi:energy-coupling factor transporter ATP-binding protein EcfA2
VSEDWDEHTSIDSRVSGSRWQRWDPHVHAPGTVLNDQFDGDDPLDEYLTRLESAMPRISAIGVTDYYTTDTYRQIINAKRNGRLPHCELIFPNVEMRLDHGTVKGRWVNIHLLVSPEDPNHLAELERFLKQISLDAFDDSFLCERAELIRLGRKANPRLTEDAAALKYGSEQFKVSLSQLREAYRKHAWAKENILIAVSGSETDGSSGLRAGADATLRQEVEKFAHVIFASSNAQREFWLGRRTASLADLRERYDGPKPCLHGSDAHEHDKVGVPDAERYSWVKGALEFDSLRQACIDPAGRAFVGPSPPPSAVPSQIISKIEIVDAEWAATPVVHLNPGLVAIIGARGSGKTALADIIAAGCDAVSDRLSQASFLTRASELLGGSSVRLHWQTGESVDRELDQAGQFEDADQYPRARYLSQKFVEELCSADGITDALLLEMERVIFEAHPLADRDGALDFAELLDLKATRFRNKREREEEGLGQISDQIGTELEKEKLVGDLKTQIAQKEKLIAGYEGDRSKLVAKGSETRVARLAELTKAAEDVRGHLRYFGRQEQALLTVKDEVSDMRRNQAPEALRRAKQKHISAGLKEEEWNPFLLDYKGDVDGLLTAHLKDAAANVRGWKGSAPNPQDDPNATYLAEEFQLDQQPLALLEAEIARIEKLVSVDRDTAARFSAISKKITEEKAALTSLREKLKDGEGARQRADALMRQREETYTRVFQAVIEEQAILTALYKPLMDRLAQAEGTLQKLTFSVARVADAGAWAKKGEELFDLRSKGPFKGKGTLLERVNAGLKVAWETGDAAVVSAAMATFREENDTELLAHAPVPKADQSNYRAWLRRFAKWLYSTDHIFLRYGIDYGGVDLRKLSPGTRGIVLLLLYLALDDADDRPLIIDQPEENLDPKSIFDELVGLFVAAKGKRQIIMVTHNANLVINTDADQIIIAEAGAAQPNQLPLMTYTSGGLETEEIRKSVCNILEGGEHAFTERARRLRVRLDR